MTARAPADDDRASLTGWLIWGICAAFFAYAFFHRVAPSVMFDHLMRDYAVGAAVLGNLSACYFYAYCLVQIPVGAMLDRVGPRLLLTGSALVAAGGSLLFGLADQIELAYAARLLIGAGTGVVFLSTLTLAGIWLPARHFAMVTGLTQAVAMLGAVAGQAPLAAFVEATGWRPAMVWAAAAGLVIAVVIWFVARDRTNRRQEPERRDLRHALADVFGNRQTWLAGLYSAGMSGPMLTFAVLWGVPYLVQAHGLGRTEAGASASLMLIGWAVAAPGIGWLSDRLGRRKPIMLTLAAVVLAAWCVVLWLPGLPLVGLQVLLVLIGAASSAMALSFAVGRELNPPANSGLATGFVNFTSIAAAAAMQPLVGWLLDLRWTGAMLDGARVFDATAYGQAFLVFPAVTLATLIGTAFLRETFCRQAVS